MCWPLDSWGRHDIGEIMEVWLSIVTWFCYQLMAKSGNKTATRDDVIKWEHFPHDWPFVWGIHHGQRPVTWSFDVFFNLRLNKCLSKDSRRRGFETLSRSLWRHSNDTSMTQQNMEMFPTSHDDVMKWKHFPRYWPFVQRPHRPPVNSLHKGQWRAALMFSLICVWINGWVNSREAGDLRRHCAHYDVSVMQIYWYCGGIHWSLVTALSHYLN